MRKQSDNAKILEAYKKLKELRASSVRLYSVPPLTCYINRTSATNLRERCLQRSRTVLLPVFHPLYDAMIRDIKRLNLVRVTSDCQLNVGITFFLFGVEQQTIYFYTHAQIVQIGNDFFEVSAHEPVFQTMKQIIARIVEKDSLSQKNWGY